MMSEAAGRGGDRPVRHVHSDEPWPSTDEFKCTARLRSNGGKSRSALDEFVPFVSASLNAVGRLLIPNIAESRRDPGQWARHAAYGAGFEEVWLAHGPDDYFDVPAVLAQAAQAQGPGITIMRVASDGTDTHPNVTYGLAAFWVFGGGCGGAYAATAHDGYSTTPFISQYNWDLGVPLEEIRRRGNGRSRSFSNGWAAVNLNMRPRRRVTFHVPDGLRGVHDQPAPSKVTVSPARRCSVRTQDIQLVSAITQRLRVKTCGASGSGGRGRGSRRRKRRARLAARRLAHRRRAVRRSRAPPAR